MVNKKTNLKPSSHPHLSPYTTSPKSSSKKETFKHRYRFPVVGSGEKFSATYFEQYNCYGEKNHKFNYVVGTISDLGEVDYRYRDSIGDLICEKLKKEHSITPAVIILLILIIFYF